jgi:hypothetical protein|nr:MAG TPA: hypothetical protein [Caudoviricetes sp.]
MNCFFNIEKQKQKIKTLFQGEPLFTFVIVGIILIVISTMVQSCMHFNGGLLDTQKKQDVVTVDTVKDAEDTNVLQNDLKVNKGNAKVIAAEVQRVHTGKTQPTEHYSYKTSAPNITQESALKEVSEKVKSRDKHLPPLALKDTDKTLIAPSAKENVDVDIYKINTYRNWELGVGVGTERGNVYVPISLQRNYSRNHSIVAELHLSPEKNMNISGGEVQWKIYFGK